MKPVAPSAPFLPLRARFLLATAAVVLVLSLSYGMVALVGYSVSFDKTTFRLLRGESNLFYTLAKWEDNKITVEMPENHMTLQSPTLAMIYDENGKLLWAQRDVPGDPQKHSAATGSKPTDFMRLKPISIPPAPCRGDG